MPKDSKEEVLEAQIQADENRLAADEKKIKKALLAIALLILVVLVNLILVYFLIFSPKQNQNKEIEKSLPTSSLSPSPTPQPSPTPKPVSNSVQAPRIKDQFIYFGSGSSSSGDWKDVGGLQATFNLGDYVNVKEIRFEASVSVVASQMVYVRLFNKSDNHPVWNSEVTAKDGLTSYVVSEPILYDKGEKIYQVQMKTQLGNLANLGQARLHIILN
ncbi:MAG: hypothetical protein HY426_04905 [Candidatus Levybacteria bacterium]|nr:hypothetical protein [Candidatus Levybacteria bacterium]